MLQGSLLLLLAQLEVTHSSSSCFFAVIAVIAVVAVATHCDR